MYMEDLNLEIVKKHLNISDDFQDDDFYLFALMDVAKDVVERSLDINLDELRNQESMLPAPIVHAMLLLIGTWYACRESVVSGSMAPTPHAYDMLIDLYKNYDWQDAILKNS